MSKYLVETYYTCTFKVNHYLDDINETELKNLEKRDDGKFEVLEVKLDNRKTKSLDPNSNKNDQNKKIDLIKNQNENKNTSVEKIVSQSFAKSENSGKRFSMPDRRKGYIQKATIGDHKVYFCEDLAFVESQVWTILCILENGNGELMAHELFHATSYRLLLLI